MCTDSLVTPVDPCLCTLEYQPWCAADGKVYPNQCSATKCGTQEALFQCNVDFDGTLEELEADVEACEVQCANQVRRRGGEGRNGGRCLSRLGALWSGAVVRVRQLPVHPGVSAVVRGGWAGLPEPVHGQQVRDADASLCVQHRLFGDAGAVSGGSGGVRGDVRVKGGWGGRAACWCGTTR